MYNILVDSIILSILILSMILFIYLGILLAKRHARLNPPQKNLNQSFETQIIEGAVFALMGLLIAFSFASAKAKLDLRRVLVVQEENAIEAARLRIKLVPSNLQSEMMNYFNQYLDKRQKIYLKLPDVKSAKQDFEAVKDIQNKIWGLGIQACHESKEYSVCMLVLPSLNTMFEVTKTRYAYALINPPLILPFFLICIALLSSLLAGYKISGRSKGRFLFAVSYSTVVATTIYIIIDMEYPRYGLIPLNIVNFTGDTVEQLLQ